MTKSINNKTRGRQSLSKNARGLSTVEYIILLVLIAVACITLWSEFGDVLETHITESKTAVESME